MIRVLVSVRSVDEALAAVEGGADFIDLKEPRDGALGSLPVETIAGVVRALRDHGMRLPVSATIGDVPMAQLDEILGRVEAVGRCGVDYVKVGIERDAAAEAVLESLAACRWPVVPVLIADHGIDPRLVDKACALPFPGLMVDTAEKRCGSLFDVASFGDLESFVTQVRRTARLAGVAGALRTTHLPLVARLAPDFAGFRSAACPGERSGDLEAARVLALVAALRSAESATRCMTA